MGGGLLFGPAEVDSNPEIGVFYPCSAIVTQAEIVTGVGIDVQYFDFSFATEPSYTVAGPVGISLQGDNFAAQPPFHLFNDNGCS
jgi:hypothetical protein